MLNMAAFVFLSSLHLQFHGGRTHFRLPGGPFQQKDHSELWNFLLVLCDAAKLLYYQRSKYHTLFLLEQEAALNFKPMSAQNLLEESYHHDYHFRRIFKI